jgi:hypothetical protein
MWDLLFWLERQRRALRRMVLGPNSYHLVGILIVLGSLAFIPFAPAGLTAGIGLIFLGVACFLTIILAPVGGCLL